MLSSSKIKKLFVALNAELAKKKVAGEIGICGGAAMCLVFNVRKATKDVDGIFEPSQKIRHAAKKVARDFDLDDDWLNDAAKAFFWKEPPKKMVLELSNLKVWAPTAEYLLAMKAIAARFDTKDKDDLIFLIEFLELKNSKAVFQIIENYYPKKMIPAKTQFLVEEVLGE